MKVTNLKEITMGSRFVQLKHPYTDEPMEGPDGKPLGFTLLPLKSHVVRAAALKVQREVLAATPDQLATAEFKQGMQDKVVGASIIGWSHNEVFGEYSPETALELVANGDNQYMAEQIQEAIKVEEDFFGA